MIAILEWVDGFGNDTDVRYIYPSLEEAMRHHSYFHYQKFEIGEKLNFDIYEAEEFDAKKFKKKRKNKYKAIMEAQKNASTLQKTS